MMGLRTSLIAVVLIAATASPATAQPAQADFQARVAALKEQVVELAGDGSDYLDTLYFAWFDRPYARATLAILVKVIATLAFELDARAQGSSAIDDDTVDSVLEWSERAIDQVLRSKPTEGFLLHRMRVGKADLSFAAHTGALFAFMDDIATGEQGGFGDLDLLAATGLRVYMRSGDKGCPTEEYRLIADRAEALGIGVVDCQVIRAFPGGCPDLFERGQILFLAWISPGLSWELLRSIADTWPPPQEEHHALPAVFDTSNGGASIGECIADSIARRALVRGVFFGSRYAAVYSAIPGVTAPTRDNAPCPVSAVMWAHAFDGQLLGLFAGWHDVHDRVGKSRPSAFLRPAHVGATLHTAVDMLRLATCLNGFSDPPSLVLTLDDNVIDKAHPNEWVPWAVSLWEWFVSRQTRFDLVPSGMDAQKLRERYRVVIPVKGMVDGDVSRTIQTIERRLALDSEHVNRLTAREQDGTIARDVLLRVGRTTGGRPCVGIVNLSDAPRVLKLRGRPAVGPSKDVISEEAVASPNDRVDFGPWQVRLLWPSDE